MGKQLERYECLLAGKLTVNLGQRGSFRWCSWVNSTPNNSAMQDKLEKYDDPEIDDQHGRQISHRAITRLPHGTVVCAAVN